MRNRTSFGKIFLSPPIKALGLGIAWAAAVGALFAVLIRALPA